MLPKKERIKTVRFNELIKEGKTVRSNVLYLKFLPNEILRFAVVIPKKIVKSAVHRHLLKRRIMASLENNKESFPVADYLIFITEQMLGNRGTVLDSIIKDLALKVASQK